MKLLSVLQNISVEFFDRVLLDAPCSGEGMFRKSDVAREGMEFGSSTKMCHSPVRYIGEASRMVKPGGCLAYTTCTFSPEENEGVIRKFLDNHPEFDLIRIEQKPGFSPAKPEWVGLPEEHKINRAVRIWPHRSQGEGHFIALLSEEWIRWKIIERSTGLLKIPIIKIENKGAGGFNKNLDAFIPEFEYWI